MPYFDGGLSSINCSDRVGVAKNFVDSGAAAPLLDNTPANENISFFLLVRAATLAVLYNTDVFLAVTATIVIGLNSLGSFEVREGNRDVVLGDWGIGDSLAERWGLC